MKENRFIFVGGRTVNRMPRKKDIPNATRKQALLAEEEYKATGSYDPTRFGGSIEYKPGGDRTQQITEEMQNRFKSVYDRNEAKSGTVPSAGSLGPDGKPIVTGPTDNKGKARLRTPEEEKAFLAQGGKADSSSYVEPVKTARQIQRDEEFKKFGKYITAETREEEQRLEEEKRVDEKTSLEKKIEEAKRAASDAKNAQEAAALASTATGRDVTSTTGVAQKQQITSAAGQRFQEVQTQLGEIGTRLTQVQNLKRQAEAANDIELAKAYQDEEVRLKQEEGIAKTQAAMLEQDKLGEASDQVSEIFEGLGIENIGDLSVEGITNLIDSIGAQKGLSEEQSNQLLSTALARQSLAKQIREAKTPEESAGLLARFNQLGITPSADVQRIGMLENLRNSGTITEEQFQKALGIGIGIAPKVEATQKIAGITGGQTTSTYAPDGSSNGLRVDPEEIFTGVTFAKDEIAPDGKPTDIGVIKDQEGNIIARQTSYFGANHGDISGETFHKGIDVVFNNGQVRALAAGEIVGTGFAPRTYGGWVQIKGDDGIITQYGHMDPDQMSHLKSGDRVNVNDIFGIQSEDPKTWGSSNGAHTDIRVLGTGEQPVETGLPKELQDIIDSSADQLDLDRKLKAAGATDEEKRTATLALAAREAAPEDRDQMLKELNIIQQLPTQLINSEVERKQLQDTIAAFPELSATELKRRFIIGEEYDQLDEKTRNVANQIVDISAGLPDDFNAAGVIAQIKRGNHIGGINTIENFRLNQTVGDSNYKAPNVENKLKVINEALEIAEANPDKMGKVNGLNTKAFIAAGFNNADAQKLLTTLTWLNAPVRQQFAGTAVTDTELKAIQGIQFDITDPEENTIQKLNTMTDLLLMSYNTERNNAGLISVEMDDIKNPTLKVDKYVQGFNLQQQIEEAAMSPEEKAAKQAVVDKNNKAKQYLNTLPVFLGSGGGSSY